MLRSLYEYSRARFSDLRDYVQRQDRTNRTSGRAAQSENIHRNNAEIWPAISEASSRAVTLVREKGSLEDIQRVLESSPDIACSINTRDLSGYSLLQYAIIHNEPAIISYLVCHGAELNSPVCSRPLHLAAKLGHTEIVQILMKYGADPNVTSSVCYPDQHQEVKSVFSGDQERWSVVCVGDLQSGACQSSWPFEIPLFYAIMSKNVECVQCFLDHGVTAVKMMLSPLHVSCALGSLECVQLFLRLSPNDVHVSDKDGLPIQLAVRWGRPYVELLVLHGASVMMNNKYNETLLHVFLNEADSNTSLVDCTSFLLDCGLHMKVNAVDNWGNSALNSLLKRLLCKPPICLPESHLSNPTKTLTQDNITDRNLSIVNQGLQKSGLSFSSEELQYIQCATLLLEAGSNPNIANKVGDTSLHLLTRVCSQPTSWSQPSNPLCSFHFIHELFSLLLRRGAKPNFVNNAQSSVLGLFVTNGCKTLFSQPSVGHSLAAASSVFHLSPRSEVDWFLCCLELLARHGCRFDVSGFLGAGCLLHEVMANFGNLNNLIDTGLTADEQKQQGTEYASQILAVLECLLRNGCSPNVCRSSENDLHYLYYKLIAHRNLLPIGLIQDAVLLLLHHGALHVPVFYHHTCLTNSYPLLHTLNIIRNQELPHQEKNLLELFHVFYMAMDSKPARFCLSHFLANSRKKDLQHLQLEKYLNDILNSPASLFQQTGAFVYKNMAQRSAKQLKMLPIPKPMIRILLGFNY